MVRDGRVGVRETHALPLRGVTGRGCRRVRADGKGWGDGLYGKRELENRRLKKEQGVLTRARKSCVSALAELVCKYSAFHSILFFFRLGLFAFTHLLLLGPLSPPILEGKALLGPRFD